MSEQEKYKYEYEYEGPRPEGRPVYWFGRNFLALCLRFYHRLRVYDHGRLPEQGGVLIVANHASFLDIPTVAASTNRHVAFAARHSLAKSRFLSYIMRESGVILIRRGAADRRALRQMVENLRAGDIVAVYPEGTRTKDGSLGTFRPGAVFLARQAKVPIVPVAIRGGFAASPRGSRLPRPARISVHYGEPIAADVPDALERAREAILAML